MYDGAIEVLCDGDMPCRNTLRGMVLVSAVQDLAAQKEKDAALTASFSKVVNE
jgi:hypothetical protein